MCGGDPGGGACMVQGWRHRGGGAVAPPLLTGPNHGYNIVSVCVCSVIDIYNYN